MATNKKCLLDNQINGQLPTNLSEPTLTGTNQHRMEKGYTKERESLGLSLIFIALVFFTGAILYCVVITSLQTPFNLSATLKRNTFYFLPQGWAFFTRDAREEKLWAYKRAQDGSLVPLNPPGGSFIYLFGINRGGRKLSSDYSRLLAGIDSTSWNHVAFDLSLIARESVRKRIFHTNNKDYTSKAKGEIVFVKKRLIPWAWSRFKSVKMPSKYVRIFVD